MIFANKGWENTPEAARLACDYARAHGIKHVVIASKTGYTTISSWTPLPKPGWISTL